MLRLPFVIAAVLALLAAPLAAQEWASWATIGAEPTAGRICAGASNGKDIVCASPGPYVDANGNVGIGMATPGEKLYVYGSTVISNSYLSGGAGGYLQRLISNSTNNIQNLYYANADTAGPVAVFQKWKGSAVELAVGDDLGAIDFFGTTAAGGGVRSARILGEADTGWGGANDSPGRLTFWTTPDGSVTSVERMRINAAGDVGIGTASPAAKLEVAGNVKIAGTLQATDTAATCASAADYGKFRYNTSTGKFQLCKP